MKTMIVYFWGDPEMFYVLETALRGLAEDVELKRADSEKALCLDEDLNRIGLLVAWNEEEFYKGLLRLSALGVARTILINPCVNHFRPWKRLQSSVKSLYDEYCVTCALGVKDILGKLRGLKAVQFMPSVSRRIRQAVTARNIVPYLKDFMHGRKGDVVNTFFGPLRMLVIESSQRGAIDPAERWKKDILASKQHFEKVVIKPIASIAYSPNSPFGDLGQELVSRYAAIREIIEKKCENLKKIMPSESLIALIEQLMLMLTEIRVQSGMSTESKDNDVPKSVDPLVIPAGTATRRPYKILVIDDHASYWRPILHAAASRLHHRLPILIEFSIDGIEVRCVGKKKPVRLGNVIADYDLVMLDVYLPGESGIQILQKIRQRLHGLPVLIWTTSLDREVAAKSTKAHGFLFKKTATCQVVSESLDTWLEAGRTRNRLSLPNSFFDHVIQTKELRDCALAFTSWALKHMDSFHALDSRYFKFFNDHGGRHIIHLLFLLEKLLRPFWYDDRSDLLFSNDAQLKEKELLAIYVAVLCHELGMFPSVGEQYEGLKKEELEVARNQHAVRGLLIISNALKKPDEYGELGSLIANYKSSFPEYGIEIVYLLVAYHSRFLSLKHEHFIRLKGHKDFPDEKQPKLLSVDKEELESVLQQIKTQVDAHKGLSERIRRLCAIFRFADGLDIDYTRVPADFILFHRSRGTNQGVENIKRQVVEEISVEGGDVDISFNAPRPRPDYLKQAISFIAEVNLGSGSGDKKKITASLKTASSIEWDNECGLTQELLKARVKLIEIKGDMDKWLIMFLKARGADKLSLEIPAIIASLSVLGEVLSEYSAILDIGKARLSKVIGFRSISWDSSSEAWKKRMTFLQDKHQSPNIALENRTGWVFSYEEEVALSNAIFRYIGESRQEDQGVVGLEPAKFQLGHTEKTMEIKLEGKRIFVGIDIFENIEAGYEELKPMATTMGKDPLCIERPMINKYCDTGVIMGEVLNVSLQEKKPIDN